MVHNHIYKSWSQFYGRFCLYIGIYFSCLSKNLIPLARQDTDFPKMISPLSILHTARGKFIPCLVKELCGRGNLQQSESHCDAMGSNYRRHFLFLNSCTEYSKSNDYNYLFFLVIEVSYNDFAIDIISDVPNALIQMLALRAVQVYRTTLDSTFVPNIVTTVSSSEFFHCVIVIVSDHNTCPLYVQR